MHKTLLCGLTETQSCCSYAQNAALWTDRDRLQRLMEGKNMEQKYVYEGWNFNSGNYLFTTDTK